MSCILLNKQLSLLIWTYAYINYTFSKCVLINGSWQLCYFVFFKYITVNRRWHNVMLQIVACMLQILGNEPQMKIMMLKSDLGWRPFVCSSVAYVLPLCFSSSKMPTVCASSVFQVSKKKKKKVFLQHFLRTDVRSLLITHGIYHMLSYF